MSQFDVVETFFGDTKFILGDDRMTEVVEQKGNPEILPYNLSRSDLKQAFDSLSPDVHGIQIAYRIGEQTGHVAGFFIDSRGRLHIGCQHFDAEEIDKLQKWAQGAAMDKDAYEKRFMQSQKITGRGLETTMHMPCPFCAAPNFLSYRIMEVQDALAKGGECVECGRGAKAVFTKTEGSVSFEMMQTKGDPAPDYIPPMRRVDAGL